MTALLLVRRYWYIPVLAIVAGLAWVFLRRRPPVEVIQTELAVVRAGVAAQTAVAEHGAAQATTLIREKYAAKMEALDAQQRADVADLESDPVALARLLERLSR